MTPAGRDSIIRAWPAAQSAPSEPRRRGALSDLAAALFPSVEPRNDRQAAARAPRHRQAPENRPGCRLAARGVGFRRLLAIGGKVNHPLEKKSHGSALSLVEQLELEAALRQMNLDECRRLMLKAGLWRGAQATGDLFVSIVHTTRLNMERLPPKDRRASEEWLRSHGFEAPLFNKARA